MVRSVRFPYSETGYPPVLTPRLSLTLTLNDRSVDVVGLVDSGATVNVLPYDIGVALGADYYSQRLLTNLGGSLASVEVRALRLDVLHPLLTPDTTVPLVFAWAHSNDVPVLFGQMNFFLEFEGCFFRAEQFFEAKRR